MKRIVIFVAITIISTIAIAQKDKDEKVKPIGQLEQADRIVIDIFSDIWMDVPSDTAITPKTINRGSNIYLFRDMPMGKSNFSFAVGLGISAHNLYSDAVPVKETTITYDSLGVPEVNYTGNTVFEKIPEEINSTTIEVKNNKLTVVYLDLPLELRFRANNEESKFKFAIGFKGGYMLSNHTKYHGNDYTNTDNGDDLKLKEYKILNIETYRFGPTFRIGWGWFNFSAYYSLSPLFKKNKGPEMYPISAGITLTPF